MKNTEKNDGYGNIVFTFVSYFGGYICNIIYIAGYNIGKAAWVLIKALWSVTDKLRKKLLRKLQELAILAATPFVKAAHSIFHALDEIRRVRLEKGKTHGVLTASKHVGRVVFGGKGIVMTLLNIVAPVVSIFFLFSIVTYASSLNYAVKLVVNGQFLGYIEKEEVFNEAELVLNERVGYLGSTTDIEVNPQFSIEKIGYSETLTKYQIADLILQNSGMEIQYAYGFYVGDVFYGALEDNQRVKKVLDQLLTEYQTGAEGEVVQFADPISCDSAGLYLTDSIIDEDWLINLITSTKTEARYYTVEYGDSHTLIGDIIDMTQAEIEALNPGFIESDLHIGDQIKMNAEVPYLSVSVTRREDYDVKVDYDVNYYDDNSLYEGTSRVTKDGVYGINHLTADVTYVNGVETARNITNIQHISDPVAAEVAMGIKPTPAGTYSNETAGYGQFIWPVDGGEISQFGYWDGGYDGHVGLDIAAPYGTAIYAGASGTVKTAGWYYNYGYCVIIYHEDTGLTTRYGHCSSLYVSVGEYVTQGQCIAAVGSTGDSTGPHCHFEVRMGSTVYNPKYYLDLTGKRINLV